MAAKKEYAMIDDLNPGDKLLFRSARGNGSWSNLGGAWTVLERISSPESQRHTGVHALKMLDPKGVERIIRHASGTYFHRIVS